MTVEEANKLLWAARTKMRHLRSKIWKIEQQIEELEQFLASQPKENNDSNN